MSDRFWIIRPSERLRFVLNIRARGAERRRDEAELQRMDAESATIGHDGLLLEIGQPVTLCLTGGGAIKGSVVGALEATAKIRFDHPLPARTVLAIRLTHTDFLADMSNRDLTTHRSVA
jgi:hypothetical protein